MQLILSLFRHLVATGVILGDINQTLANFGAILISFGRGAVIIMLAIGGYLLMTSESHPQRRAGAYAALASAALGLMIVILAPSLADLFKAGIK